MPGPRGSSEQTKARILATARQLFAERGVAEVTVRDIAAVAGVNHALVHRYFGTKEEMIAAILRSEVAAWDAVSRETAARTSADPEDLRRVFAGVLGEARTTILLMMRSELAGLEPEKMLAGDSHPFGVLAKTTAQTRQQNRTNGGAKDPVLLSAVVGAAVFGFVGMAPWLMMAVGLQPGDYEARKGEIVDILATIALSCSTLA